MPQPGTPYPAGPYAQPASYPGPPQAQPAAPWPGTPQAQPVPGMPAPQPVAPYPGTLQAQPGGPYPGAPQAQPGGPYPGTVPPQPGGPAPGASWTGQPAAPAGKSGRGRRVVGILLMVLGICPVLAGGGVVAQAISNSRVQIANDDFKPLAWHNLPADKVFPDHFGMFEGTWSRQGIDPVATCDKAPVSADLAEAVNQHGCRSVLRATYVDESGTLVTTIGILVLGSNADTKPLIERFRPGAGYKGQPLRAYPVPGTPAAGWKDANRAGYDIVGYDLDLYEQPYVILATMGYADGRKVAKLPEPWDMPGLGSANERSLDLLTRSLVQQFRARFDLAMEGKK
ncbi:hypothetical protein AB0J86_22140 [Micromonospora sp. NPDC049559]|uniref:hypothetical protein n=1 Tax=Micromonospora sp. NPDC049559 TaxID=3155923 RepID=UPI00342431EB